MPSVAPNKEQILAGLRWVITVAGALGLGSLFSDNVLLSWVQGNLEMVATILAIVATFVWSLFRHTEKNQVSATIAIPEVKKIETMPTAEGAKLAASVPSPSVVTASH